MTVYNMSVVHGLKMDDAVICITADDAVSFINPHDLNLVTGRVTLKIKREGTAEDDALAGELVVGTERIQLVRALPTLTSRRDIDQSDGKLRISDKKFRIPQAELEFAPEMGDQVQVGTQTFEILAVDDVTQSNAYLIWCRG